MTTPNVEELITDLQGLANEIEISYRIESIEEAVKALQSQAERMAVLERESETHAKAYGLAIVERNKLRTEVEAVRKANLDCVDHYNAARTEIDTLRDQLSAIDKAKSVASHYFDIEGNLYTANRARFLRPSLNGLTPLFTRPMPAESNAELVEALEEYGRAGVGNSTDWRVQLSALRLATAALSKYKGAK